MDRRKFMGMAAVAAGSVALERGASASEMGSGAKKAGGGESPFPLSVMLWTVFRELPFEERLKKVAEAGYTNVELVGEYAKWTR